MSLAPGTRLGLYEVLAPIGAGSMGEVYRARDTKLGRDVAIKVLPEAFAQNADRLARFGREAHVLASLNHPNIAIIHGLDESAGIHYLVLELVPGETLADHLAREGFGLHEALSIGRQIAAALEAAHERGTIHRDLKPANIKLTPDGKVKVLDFGLAKVVFSDRADVVESSNITVSATGEGTLLGTVAYMSPEQARGKPVDKRTDIWSFGCVLYELLTRRKPFVGPTVSDTIAALLERDPNWTAFPRTTPANMVRLVKRCLQKDVSQRLHDIADARIEIDEALALPAAVDATPAAAPGPSPIGRWKLATATLALIAAASVMAVGWVRVRSGTGGSSSAMVLKEVARLTHDALLSEWPTWSPDGTLIAFASNRGGNFDVYVRRVEGGQEVDITDDPAEDLQPAFSPDGKSIAFVSTRSSRTSTVKISETFGMEFRTYGGDVWVAPALGGRARRLAQDGNFPTWNPAGQVVAYVSGPENHRSILAVPAEGGAAKPLLPVEASSWEIVRLQYSPNGRWLSFETATPGRVFLIAANGGSARELLRGINHVWDPSGERIYYLTREPLGGTRLQWVGIDPATGNNRGTPDTLGIMTGLLRDLAISRDGTRLAAAELEGSLNLTRLPLTAAGDAPAGSEEVLSLGQVIDRYPSFSPDGRRVAYASDRLGREEIWVLDAGTRRSERLQLPGEDLGANLAYWTPDGRQISVTRFFQNGSRSLWSVAVDGSRAEELVPAAAGVSGSPISPDGRMALYSATVGRWLQLFTFDLATRKTTQLTSSPDDKFVAYWSPDMRWIAYVSNASGSLQMYRMPASGGEAKRLTSGNDRIRHAFYSPDGRWLYVQPNHQNIYRMPADGGPLQPVTRFPVSGLFLEEPTISPDGHYLLYSRSVGGSSLWTLTIGNRGVAAQASSGR